MRTVRDVDVRNKRVLLRCDLNVPVIRSQVTDDSRIQAALPTLRHLVHEGARIILCTHLGDPGGRSTPRLRLDPVIDRLQDLLRAPISAIDAVTGPKVDEAVSRLLPGHVLVLDNLRFHVGEVSNDDVFARDLAQLADLYVNDAFGAVHHAHASLVQVPRHLPSVAGLLVASEVRVLTELRDRPERPYVAVLGGRHLRDEVVLIERLLDQVDALCIGGAVGNTFLAARGVEIGQSVHDEDALRTARDLLDRAGDRIVLPVDVGVALEPHRPSARVVCGVSDVPPEASILDVDHRTLEAFEDRLRGARTVLWNGPMGLIEKADFTWGTRELARRLAGLDAKVYAGGVETVTGIRMAGVGDRLHHVSTGGEAFIAFLDGRPLPALEALEPVPA